MDHSDAIEVLQQLEQKLTGDEREAVALGRAALAASEDDPNGFIE